MRLNGISQEYIKSALITFVAGFALAVVPEISNLTVADLTNGTLVGVVFAGIRTGVKMLLEAFLVWYSSR